MAQTMYCTGHPDTPAVMLIQQLGTPEVMTLCAPCVITWAGAVVASVDDGPDVQPESETESGLGAGPITEQEQADAMVALADLEDAEVAELAELGSDTSEGGDEHDGTLREIAGGTGDGDRQPPGEEGAAGEGASSETVVGRRTGQRKPAGGTSG